MEENTEYSPAIALLSFGFRTSAEATVKANSTFLKNENETLVSDLSGLTEAISENKSPIRVIQSFKVKDEKIKIAYPLKLIGNPGVTIEREASDNNNKAFLSFSPSSLGSSISGLNWLNNSFVGSIIGIAAEQNGMSITDCNFDSSMISASHGIEIDEANSNIVIEGNTFTGEVDSSVFVNGASSVPEDPEEAFAANIIIQKNRFSTKGDGIFVLGASNVLIENNWFIQEEESFLDYSMVLVSKSKNLRIRENTFNSIDDTSIGCMRSNTIQIEQNLINSPILSFEGSKNIWLNFNKLSDNSEIEISSYVDRVDDRSCSNIVIENNTLPQTTIDLKSFSSSDHFLPLTVDNGMKISRNYWGFVPSLDILLTGEYKKDYVNGTAVELTSWFETPPVEKTETADWDQSPVQPSEMEVLNTQATFSPTDHGTYLIKEQEETLTPGSNPVEIPTETKVTLAATPDKGYLLEGVDLEKTVPDFPSAEDIPEVKVVENTAEFEKRDFAITVKPRFLPVIEAISIDPDKLSLTAGDTTVLTAEIVPSGEGITLRWESTDPSIATIDHHGQVTAIVAGTATITASAQGLSASCEVTVINPPRPSRPTITPTPTPEPSPGPDSPSDIPSDQPVIDGNSPDFEPDSGINSGVSGTGPGFTESGSTTAINPETNEQITYTQNENGTKAATTQNASGQITKAVITIPASSIEEGVVYPSLGENEGKELLIPGNSTSESRAPEITLNLPQSVDKAKIVLPIEPGTLDPGTVAMIWNGEEYAAIPATVLDEENGTISFPLEKSARIIILNNAITFADENGVPDYARTAAAFTSARGLMTGMGNTMPKPFDFNAYTSRGQFAVILYRLENEPEVFGPYPDGIIPGAWNADAARWAKEKGLMGQGNSPFNAEQSISRDQIMTILWRNQGSPQVSLSYLDPYQDADKISLEDYRKAMAWGVKEKLIGQDPQMKLYPADFATRAEIAAIFQRAIEVLY